MSTDQELNAERIEPVQRIITLELPHTRDCLVCGRDNRRGLNLSFRVEPGTGIVGCEFKAENEQCGFDGIVHGGLVATVLDELMVWAATWKIRRFCATAELTVRYRFPVLPGEVLRAQSVVEFSRPKLIETAGKIYDSAGKLLCTASGKYSPLTPEQHQRIVKTCIVEPSTAEALAALR